MKQASKVQKRPARRRRTGRRRRGARKVPAKGKLKLVDVDDDCDEDAIKFVPATEKSLDEKR